MRANRSSWPCWVQGRKLEGGSSILPIIYTQGTLRTLSGRPTVAHILRHIYTITYRLSNTTHIHAHTFTHTHTHTHTHTQAQVPSYFPHLYRHTHNNPQNPTPSSLRQASGWLEEANPSECLFYIQPLTITHETFMPPFNPCYTPVVGCTLNQCWAHTGK
jgi:hypothetical protein